MYPSSRRSQDVLKRSETARCHHRTGTTLANPRLSDSFFLLPCDKSATHLAPLLIPPNLLHNLHWLRHACEWTVKLLDLVEDGRVPLGTRKQHPISGRLTHDEARETIMAVRVDAAVPRNGKGAVTRLRETAEAGISPPAGGE